MRVLIIEDEQKTAAYLSQGLVEQGFVADIANNGRDGLYLAKSNSYDIVILDVTLPDCEGWSVIRQLRDSDSTKHVPVLFLTARDSVPERVRGLELGADDYLVKPFAFSELLARIRTVLRRGSSRQADELSLGGLTVDLQRRRVQRQGRQLDLTPKEFVLLTLLMRRTGEVLSRTLIAEQVWDINFDSHTNVVDVHIRRLRLKVDDPFDYPLIHTVRGVGYVLEVRQ